MPRTRTLARLLLALLAIAVGISACGGDDGDETGGSPDAGSLKAKEVVAAFEQAAGGYPFEKSTTLVDGAVAYGPKSSADPDVVGPLNDALGDASVLWQVLIFDGPSPPEGKEAAKAAAFSSNTFDSAGKGVYLGDNDIAYAANRNAVITGPVLNGDTDDQTLIRWKAVLDGL